MFKRLGYFRELKYGTESDPSIVESKFKLPSESVKSVLQYLKSGNCSAISPGLSFDYFEPKRVIGPMESFNDGVWSWNSDLIYYIENYNVGLPQDFLEYLETKKK